MGKLGGFVVRGYDHYVSSYVNYVDMGMAHIVLQHNVMFSKKRGRLSLLLYFEG